MTALDTFEPASIETWQADPDTETVLVGAILLDPTAFPVVSSIVKPGDFTDPAARATYSAMLALYHSGSAIDEILLFTELKRQNRLKVVGGISGLSRFTDAATSGANAKFYAQELARAAQDRRRSKALLDAALAVQSGRPSMDVWRDLQDNFAALSGDGGKINVLDAGDWLREHIPGKQIIIDSFLDVGDKCFLIGGPKTRKSFFVMQLALALAMGDPFLGFTIPAPCRVAICQMELQAHHYHRRLARMAAAKAIDYASLKNQLFILNLRGVIADIADVTAELLQFKPMLVVIDPIYKTYAQGHDENSAGDAAALLAKFDHMANTLDCAILIVHHDNKAASGVTKSTSRGSGSNTIARDYDSAFLLMSHENEADGLVLECITRNHPPREPVTILWDMNRFVLANGIPAVPETVMSRATKAKQGPHTDDMVKSAKKWIRENGGKIPTVVLQDKIRRVFSVGRDKAYDAAQLLEVSHDYRRAKDPETKKWFIYSPDYKPQLPELPGTSGLPFQEVPEQAARHFLTS